MVEDSPRVRQECVIGLATLSILGPQSGETPVASILTERVTRRAVHGMRAMRGMSGPRRHQRKLAGSQCEPQRLCGDPGAWLTRPDKEPATC